jgi:hypothetical protein
MNPRTVPGRSEYDWDVASVPEGQPLVALVTSIVRPGKSS